MSNLEVGLHSIIAVLIIIQTGMHIAMAMMAVSFIGVWIMKGSAIAGKLIALAAAEKIAPYGFGVIPLFVMIGLLVAAGDIGKDTLYAASKLLHRLKGVLAISTVGVNAVFAAVTGSSIASASVFTKVAVPEMMRHNCQPRFAVGVVAGSSVLGMLIPPSMLMIIYGIITETSIGDLFIAGIIPGLLLSLAFMVLILMLAIRSPEQVWNQDYDSIEDNVVSEDNSLFSIWMKLIPIGLLMVLVVGGIYGGLFTPIEAGGVVTLGALVIGLARRKLDLKELWSVAVETGYVTAPICFLLIAAQIYASMLAMSGLPSQAAAVIQEANFGYLAIIIGYVVLVLVLGSFLESVSIADRAAVCHSTDGYLRHRSDLVRDRDGACLRGRTSHPAARPGLFRHQDQSRRRSHSAQGYFRRRNPVHGCHAFGPGPHRCRAEAFTHAAVAGNTSPKSAIRRIRCTIIRTSSIR